MSIDSEMMSESFNGWERWCKRLTADTPPSVDEATEFCLFARQWLPSLLMRAAIRPGLVPVSPVRHGASDQTKAPPGLQDIAELLRDRAEALSAERPDVARLMWQGAKTLDALIDAIVQKGQQGEEQPLLQTLARALPARTGDRSRDELQTHHPLSQGPDEEKVYLRQKVDSLIGALTEQAALHGGLAERVKLAETRAKAAEAEAKRLHKTLASLKINPTAEPSAEVVASLRDALSLLKDERKKRDKSEERERTLRNALEEARIEQATRAAPALQLEALAQLPRSAVPQLPGGTPVQPALRSSAPVSYPEADRLPASPPLPTVSSDPVKPPAAATRRVVREAPEPSAPGHSPRPMRSSEQMVAAYRAERTTDRPQTGAARIDVVSRAPAVPAAPAPRPPTSHATSHAVSHAAPSQASRTPVRDNGTRIRFITSEDV
ncbi:hypothetical protein C7450_11821 [Chelatococcus asaccharovorans]|uniref:Uncharacterized protein n=2 Tax=Chelatococcus asaccharovorans TaxID=28210 RepID=A0A2V3TTV6_9HYPH|nr:hypothetical protein C7450_11821 [Chelatococcus asaccharovorans]